MNKKRYWKDASFQNKLVAHLCRDRWLLKEIGNQMSSRDFKPTNPKEREQWARWVTVGLALDYWKKYRQPVNGMLKAEVLSYLDRSGAGERQEQALLHFQKIIRKQTLEAGPALVERVTEFRQERARLTAIEKLIGLQEEGKLTDENMMQTCREVLALMDGKNSRPSDFLSDQEMERRVSRRLHQQQRNDTPLFLIEPLDALVKGIRRGELGLLMAPYKRGKSLWLIHQSLALTVQNYNVLHITAEDPKETVEDRFDAAMAKLPVMQLAEKEDVFRVRFKRLRRILHGRLFTADATEGQCSLSWIEERLQEYREMGVMIDAVIIDYDDEIEPPRKQKERRMEFSDIYKGLRRIAARWDVLVWTAAQTKRDTEKKKIIRGDDAAEDISKLRKVTMCLTLGNGEDQHERGLYLFVAAHRNDQKHVGTYLVHDQKRSVIYDRDATMRLVKRMKLRRQAN